MTPSRSQELGDHDPPEADPWGAPEEVPEWDPVAAVEPESVGDDEPSSEPVGAAVRSAAVEPARRPDGRLARARRRLVGAARAPLFLAAACALAVVGVADGWRSALLATAAAVAVAATRLRFGPRAALGLLVVTALLALAGWGPGADRPPVRSTAHHGHRHGRPHAARAHRAKA